MIIADQMAAANSIIWRTRICVFCVTSNHQQKYANWRMRKASPYDRLWASRNGASTRLLLGFPFSLQTRRLDEPASLHFGFAITLALCQAFQRLL